MNAGNSGQPKQKSVQELVREAFDADTQETGLHIDHVIRALKHIPEIEIRKAVSYLTDEGHLYSTIDEVHFKSINA